MIVADRDVPDESENDVRSPRPIEKCAVSPTPSSVVHAKLNAVRSASETGPLVGLKLKLPVPEEVKLPARELLPVKLKSKVVAEAPGTHVNSAATITALLRIAFIAHSSVRSVGLCLRCATAAHGNNAGQ